MTLDDFMREHGYTDADCAAAVGTTQPTVSRWRRGRRRPREPFLTRIAVWSGYKVTANDLYGVSPPPSPTEPAREIAE